MTEEKKGKKCICCAVVGIVLIVLGLFADNLGIGSSAGYGYKQILVIILGVILLVCGTIPCKFDKFCKCSKGDS